MIYRTKIEAHEAMQRKEIAGYSEMDGIFTGIDFPAKKEEIPFEPDQANSGSDPIEEIKLDNGGSDDEW